MTIVAGFKVNKSNSKDWSKDLTKMSTHLSWKSSSVSHLLALSTKSTNLKKDTRLGIL